MITGFRKEIYMHIEKISDNQIKCTLTQTDLAARQLSLKELAYGTDKVRSLFNEMIDQANRDFGFTTDDMPLMVEAVPISKDSIMLVITRIDNADELDTRFSRFSTELSPEEDQAAEQVSPAGADDILDAYKIFKEMAQELGATAAGTGKDQESGSDAVSAAGIDDSASGQAPSADIQAASINLVRIFSYKNLDDVLQTARVLHSYYNGVNSLYKDPEDGTYYLVLKQSHHSPEEFNKTCNLASEYGSREQGGNAREAFFREHYKLVVNQTALQRLYVFL